MENIQKLIKALEIIAEKEPETKFNFEGGYLYIGDTELYSEEEKNNLAELEVFEDEEFNCFVINNY